MNGIHRARWVMVAPDLWLEDGEVRIEGNRIASVGPANRDNAALEHGAGVIMPALVNAHAHLGLSMLKEMSVGLRRDLNVGESRFIGWVKDLIAARESFTTAEVRDAAIAAALSAKQAGTGTVAEVGPTEPGAEALSSAGIEGVVFAELLGNHRELPELPQPRDRVAFSYAGHALHTTHPELLRSLKSATMDEKRLFSLHLAESEIEVDFLATGNGSWASLLTERCIDFSDWGPWGERPVARAGRLGLLGPGTLAVHVLQATREEFAALARTGTAVCVCPRSNEALHGRLPDIEGMLAAGLQPALGTDSLASVPTVDLFDDLACVASRSTGVAPETILAMGTRWAASALGMTDLGSLGPGNRASVLYVDLDAANPRDAADKLVNKEFHTVVWLS